MIILTSLSCSNEIKKTTYVFNSEEYNEKIKEFDVSFNNATAIASRLYFEKNPNAEAYHFSFDLILGDYYIFCDTNRLYNLKTTQYVLNGIWVNGKTGEALQKDTDVYVKVLLDIPFTKLNSNFGTIKNKTTSN
jgi:hypothetical protein